MDINYPLCKLKPRAEESVLRRHPWVLPDAIESVENGINPGDLLRVVSSNNSFLGVGYFNPNAPITIRLFSFTPRWIDGGFFDERISQAADLRKKYVLNSTTNACRIVNAEGDSLPGLIVDLYNNILIVKFLTLGMEKQKKIILPILEKNFPVKAIYEKVSSKQCKLEGMDKESQTLAGNLPSGKIEILENSMRFQTLWKTAQKTGFSLAQRENRKLIRSIAYGKHVLDCFCYNGGFSVAAALGGAKEVMSVDQSEHAIDSAVENMKVNASHIPHFAEKRDVFEFLNEDSFEPNLIILDPPSFCTSHREIEDSLAKHKSSNASAIKKLPSGGLLYTTANSRFISHEAFQQALLTAAKEMKKDIKILVKTGNPIDHPFSIYHPEGENLKGLLLEVH